MQSIPDLKKECEELKEVINKFHWHHNILHDHRNHDWINYSVVEKYPDEFTNIERKKINDEIKNYKNSSEKIQQIYTEKLKILRKEYDDRLLEIKELEEKEKADQLKNGCKTINELHKLLTNEHQKEIFSKILTNSEYSKLYLSNYEPNIDPKKNDTYGTIKVLGTYNFKKAERELYSIKIYKESEKGTFWCSCPDHKFNSSKKNTVCKHICFIVCKILKYLNVDFFTNKTLSEEQINTLIKKLTSNDMTEIDKSLIKKFVAPIIITKESFMNFVKQIDAGDDCPICFESINDKTKLACPSCHNYIHEECALVCLETRNTCLFCMDDIWKNYKKLHKN